MARLLHLDSSARTEGSQSRQVAATFRETWEQQHPQGRVVYRDLAAEPLPHLRQTVLATGLADDQVTPEQRAARTLQDGVIEEFLAADAYLISLPMYNFGIPSQLKAYLDHVLLVGRVLLTDGSPSPVAGRPATVVVSFGGGYGPGTPRESYDFVRPYLSKVLGETLGLELEIVTVELTLAATVPAMAPLVPLADRSRADAHAAAGERAKVTAQLLAS